MSGRKHPLKSEPTPEDDVEAGVLFDKDLIDTADDLEDLADDLLNDPAIQAALDDPTQDEEW